MCIEYFILISIIDNTIYNYLDEGNVMTRLHMFVNVLNVPTIYKVKLIQKY